MEPKPVNVQRLLFSRKETAELLSLSVATIDMLMSRGRLAVRRMGRKRLIPYSSIMAFSQKNISHLWPEKVGGKSTRHVEPSEFRRRA